MTTLAQRADEYLQLRRALGAKLEEDGRLLPRFVAHLDALGVETITVRLALEWVQQPLGPPGSTVWAARMRVVRGFARHMAAIDPNTEVPPSGLVVPARRRRSPFIYSSADIAALRQQIPRTIPSPLRAATYDTVIGLLAATGMRPGEVIALRRDDIDWSEGVLSVRESKFGKSRLVPLHPSTTEALTSYARERDKLCHGPTARSFFVSQAGTAVIHSNLAFTFRKLVRCSGVGAGSPLPPRMHDFRHSFAVHTMLRWYHDGGDVQVRMPWLSTYLGHREPRYTYWYLTAVPGLLDAAATRLEAAQEASA